MTSTPPPVDAQEYLENLMRAGQDAMKQFMMPIDENNFTFEIEDVSFQMIHGELSTIKGGSETDDNWTRSGARPLRRTSGNGFNAIGHRIVPDHAAAIA